MFQSMNKWLLLFSLRVLGQHKLLCSPERVRDRIWETEGDGKKRQKKKHAQRKVLQCLTRRAVTQEMNIFASLNSDWCVKRHRCTAHSPSSPPATTEHTPVNLTVAFNFIILHICSVFSFPHQCKWNTFLCGDFYRNVLFTRDIIRCTLLIIFCIPCPLNGMTTAAALLGLRDGHSERFDLAWASCKVFYSPKDKTTYQW